MQEKFFEPTLDVMECLSFRRFFQALTPFVLRVPPCREFQRHPYKLRWALRIWKITRLHYRRLSLSKEESLSMVITHYAQRGWDLGFRPAVRQMLFRRRLQRMEHLD